ncbi:amino acid adenylation domain-containing protein [Fulvivirga sp. 29W222]|uniref:Amino acid adenylation domain-containing protein n=1 Tax=Fulvivirga marina TaxID=2494733 RepID=A0A937G286_9BACT|nr:non-ribosomal peptide synthetase/type I polyketide synthase [Fulvivirga marina]MBL6449307.1 amino acid adenylation domain-containing protein [Fulvivirga marina]
MQKYNGMEIAIVGMSCQFPGAKDVLEFWQNLKDGKESIKQFSKEELLAAGVPKEVIDNPRYIGARGDLSGAEYFDSEFFGYRAAEAKLMDPQLRLFYQHCWKAVEDAAYDLHTYDEKIGLFAGGGPNNNWENAAILSNTEGEVEEVTASQLRNISYLSTRVSYKLNLKGPSLYLNTTCSTSLVAIQRACMSLLLRECKMSLAGGVFITNYPDRGYRYEEGMIYSKDGHCRAFDHQSSGTVAGEGIGVLLLKRLDDALKDGDTIHAVIKGSGINNDGAQKVSYTAPSADGQQEAIMKALKMAKVPKESVTYIETHGTGTALGDVIEVDALNRVYGESDQPYCALGSVKTNIGHLVAASGVAGIIKTIMALKHEQIPPSLNFEVPNSKINFHRSPFYVNTALRKWDGGKYPLRAGVSSFGIGGTNVHMILEQAPRKEETPAPARNLQLLQFSAKSEKALDNNMANFRDFLLEYPETNLADAAYTLQTGRSEFSYRKTLVADSVREAITKLRIPADLKVTKASKSAKKLAFMFSGQGGQYQGMGIKLMQEKVFRQYATQSFEIAKRLTGKDFYKILESSPEEVDQTMNSQPLIFIIQYAVAKQLMHWGYQPDVLLGHSIGEYAAACISGIIDLEDALKLVIARGELMQQQEKGQMLSVAMGRDELISWLSGRENISIAASNSSAHAVASGSIEAIEDLRLSLEEKGIHSRVLHTSHAFHSYMMEPVLEPFRKTLDETSFHRQEIPVISSVTGLLVDGEMQDKSYWSNQIVEEVQFSKALESLLTESSLACIEIGPGDSLSTFVRSHDHRMDDHDVFNTISKPDQVIDDNRYLLQTIGKLWSVGLRPDWNKFYEHENRSRINLPTYEFDKVEYPLYVDSYKMISDLIAKGGGASPNPVEWTHKLIWEIDAMSATRKTDEKPVWIFSYNEGLQQTSHVEGNYNVRLGATYQQIADRQFEINPADPSHFTRLFEETNMGDVRIVYALDNRAENDANSHVETCYYGLINLAKALGDRKSQTEVDLLTVTFGGYKVLPEDSVNPFYALAAGVTKIITKEYATIQGMQLDLPEEEEWLSIASKEPVTSGEVVAYRKGMRFKQGVKPFALKAENKMPVFKDNGVYLISGGTGGIGLALAQQMAEETNGAQFILIGRKELPEPKHWAQSDNDTIKRIREIETAGGQVHYIAMDIADKTSYSSLKEKISQIGQVNGVIHAAGSIDKGGIIQNRDRAADSTLINTKVFGALNLLEEFAHDQLDFFLNCSSAAAFKAPVGEVGYVSVNLFLDALAYQYPTVKSIGWNAWSESGMAVKAGNGMVGVNSVSNKEGFLLFRNMLTSLECHVIISRSILTAFQKADDANERGEEQANHTNENPINQAATVEERLIVLWERFFGKETIKPFDDFFELGGDSLKALTMINWIKKEFSVDVLITDFFKRSSVRQLGEFIEDTLGSAKENVISKAKLASKYPVSAAQNRLYFLWNYDKDSLGYNLPQFVKVEGELDKEKLSKAFSQLVERHEILRTSFVHEGDQVYQKVQNVNFEVEHAEIHENELEVYFEQFCKPFDLSKAPLLRVKLLKIEDALHYLLVDIHHIATDGISQGILLNEFAALYAGEALEKPKIQYKDFAVWQKEQTGERSWKTQKSFWVEQFEGELPVLDLPGDYKRPVEREKPGGKVSFEIESELQSQIASFNEEQHVTSFMFLFSAYSLLLGKLARTTDVVIGTPTAGRPHHDVEGLVGMFVNTLPIRSRFDDKMTFIEFVQSVKNISLQAFDNQQYPFDELLNDLKVRRESNRHPLFDVMFSLQNFGGAAIQIPGITLRRQERKLGHNKFDLSLTGYEGKDRLLFNFEYSGDLFDGSTIERFAKCFRQILEQVAGNPDILISDIKLVDEKEYELVVNEFNQTRKLYPDNTTILDLFEKQVEETPDANAVYHEDAVLTYRQLNGKANTLANNLQSYAISEGSIVPVVMSRGIDFLVSVIAIWKLKAAPAPLSIYWPEARIKNAIAKLNAPVTLVNNLGVDESGLSIEEGFHLVESGLLEETESNLPEKPGTELPMYIFHTSGTTGMPKAVVVPHKGVYNRFMWMNDYFGKASAQSVLRTTKHIFDSAIWQLMWPLVNGGQTVIPSEERMLDLRYFNELIEEYGITMTDFVPSLFNEMVRQMKAGTNKFNPFKLKDIVIGGEAITPETTNFFIRKYPQIRLTNLYGPTEASIGCVYYPVEEEKEIIPIGKPISNTKIYILDQNKQVVPVGVPGELCIAGVCLATGYFGDNVLTDDKFVADILDSQPGKMYKTGDLAKWLPDGNIAFLGRIDDQVKIRGYRIELGEIQSILNKANGVNESVVLVHDNDLGNKILVAYLVVSDTYDEADAREYLKAQLPNYMVPSRLITMDKLPVHESGKIDKAKLPKPDFKQERKAPKNEVEQQLVNIWSGLLGIDTEELSVDANFFEMGGHSLMAIRVVSAVRELLGVNLTIKSIFVYPTIEELADYLGVFAPAEEGEDEYESFEI